MAVEELRFVLPEACVVWLLQAEPWLLMGVSPERLEQVRPPALAKEPPRACVGTFGQYCM